MTHNLVMNVFNVVYFLQTPPPKKKPPVPIHPNLIRFSFEKAEERFIITGVQSKGYLFIYFCCVCHVCIITFAYFVILTLFYALFEIYIKRNISGVSTFNIEVGIKQRAIL